VPAAAVIPAPEAYVKVAAVKTLVVGFMLIFIIVLRRKSLNIVNFKLNIRIGMLIHSFPVYLEKILLFKQGLKPMLLQHGMKEKELGSS
jgi:hypothetical protein